MKLTIVVQDFTLRPKTDCAVEQRRHTKHVDGDNTRDGNFDLERGMYITEIKLKTNKVNRENEILNVNLRVQVEV